MDAGQERGYTKHKRAELDLQQKAVEKAEYADGHSIYLCPDLYSDKALLPCWLLELFHCGLSLAAMFHCHMRGCAREGSRCGCALRLIVLLALASCVFLHLESRSVQLQRQPPPEHAYSITLKSASCAPSGLCLKAKLAKGQFRWPRKRQQFLLTSFCQQELEQPC